MDAGALTSGLLTGPREGVEASLIVGIILAYLAQTGNRQHFGKIWAGTGAAIGRQRRARRHPVRDPGRVRGAVRAAVRGGGDVPGRGRPHLDAVLDAPPGADGQGRAAGRRRPGPDQRLGVGLAALAFTAIIREGLETSLFLFGQVTAAEANGAAACSSVPSSGWPSRLSSATSSTSARGASTTPPSSD